MNAFPSSLRPDALALLDALRSEPLDHRQLVADLQLAPAAVRGLIDELCDAGYVHGESDGTPARVVWQLTPQGRGALL